MSTRAEITKSGSGCFNVNMYDNHGRYCFTLPDSNWYNFKELKGFIKYSGCTCVDLTRLSKFEQDILEVS